MPRAGLTRDEVVAAGAALADEIGFPALTMGLLASKLGVRAPSLYKHVESLADLRHRVATSTMIQLGDQIRDAIQGRSGLDALTALLTATRDYVSAHQGSYAATTSEQATGPDDPLAIAGARVIGSITAVLSGYGIADSELTHAIRTIRSVIHGFAAIQASHGFQWREDPEQTFAWMIRFIDQGLRAATPGPRPPARSAPG